MSIEPFLKDPLHFSICMKYSHISMAETVESIILTIHDQIVLVEWGRTN
jgi:hypothetical protein